MTVNGRVGRRTVCVLDGKGVEMEVVDMAETETETSEQEQEQEQEQREDEEVDDGSDMRE